MHRKIVRSDGNCKEITDGLRKFGASVTDLGVMDKLVGFRGKNYIFEFKKPHRKNHKNQFTEAQKKFKETWRGSWNIVYSLEEAIEILMRG